MTRDGRILDHPTTPVELDRCPQPVIRLENEAPGAKPPSFLNNMIAMTCTPLGVPASLECFRKTVPSRKWIDLRARRLNKSVIY